MTCIGNTKNARKAGESSESAGMENSDAAAVSGLGVRKKADDEDEAGGPEVAEVVVVVEVAAVVTLL